MVVSFPDLEPTLVQSITCRQSLGMRLGCRERESREVLAHKHADTCYKSSICSAADMSQCLPLHHTRSLHTLATHSLHTHYTLTTHSPHTHYTLHTLTTYTLHTLTTHSPHTHHIHTLHTLHTHHTLITHYTHSLHTHTHNNGYVKPKSYLLQCFEVLYHSWISQYDDFLIPNSSPVVFIPFKTR